jgi:hypothetical protein
MIAKLYAFLKLGKLDEGLKLAEECLAEVDKDSINWHAFQDNYFLLALRKKNYELAINIIEDVFGHKTFNELPEGVIQKWSLYRAYLFYLTGDKNLTKKIDYNSIIEDIPEFQKDKAGINLAILILQVITHLDDDLAKLHNIISAMDDYVNKYLNNSFSKRTKVFCKLIHKVAAHNKDFELILQKSKYLTEKLIESESDGDVYADLEIVPYQHLWDIVVQRLSVLRFQSA